MPGLSGVRPRLPPGPRFQDALQPLLVHRKEAVPVSRQAPARRPGAAATAGREALASAIRVAAGTAGVDPALSVAVARAESNLDPTARSSDGLSAGTFQMTRATAAEMRRKITAGRAARPAGPDDVALGVGYLRYLQDVFSRPTTLGPGLRSAPVPDPSERQLFAVAAFNAGEGRVAGAQARARAAGGDPTRFANVRPFLPPITRGYVGRVVAYAQAERAV